MATEVDIANLALGHLGDSATVASLDPPEGSAQAEHCARFYPISRDSLLEMYPWNFSARKTALAEVANPWDQWAYAYALPSDCLTAVAVISPEATGDYTAAFNYPGQYSYEYPSCGQIALTGVAGYAPQQFAIETNASGQKVLYTNQEQAVLRYQTLVTDPTKFSQLFVATLSWQLASMLAGPIIKGEQGAAEAKRCQQMMAVYLGQARQHDANQSDIKIEHVVPFIAGR
jgi:hypothetical protein